MFPLPLVLYISQYPQGLTSKEDIPAPLAVPAAEEAEAIATADPVDVPHPVPYAPPPLEAEDEFPA
jgi:hypothetical protein